MNDVFGAVSHSHHSKEDNITFRFLPPDAMHSADCAVARCPPLCMSVRPSDRLSVTRRYSVETAKHIIKLFVTSGSHTILVFVHQTVWQYADRISLNGGVECKYINGDFDYLRNDTRYGHSYYGMRIGNLTQAFELYRFQ